MIVRKLINIGMDWQERKERGKAITQLIVSIILLIIGIVALFFNVVVGIILLAISALAFLGSRYSKRRTQKLASMGRL